MSSLAIEILTIEQAKNRFLQEAEFGGAKRQMIGGYPVTEDAAKMPWMSDEEFAEIQASVHEHGLIDPIELNGSEEISDGRNRFLACLAQDVEPHFKYSEMDSDSDVSSIRNLCRRHLSPSVRAALYLRLRGEAGEGIVEDDIEMSDASDDVKEESSPVSAPVSAPIADKPKKGKTIAEHAAAAGVSERTMQQAITVEKEGVPEVKDAVEKGQLSQSEAVKIVKKPEEEQRKAVEQKVSERAEGGKKQREVSEANFSVDAYMSSFERLISKKLANVPPGVKDTIHRRMSESLGSTVRMERETADLMNSEGFVPYVEQLIAEMPKSERSGAEKALAEKYGNVVTVKDAEAAIIKINGVIESLGDREKKKLSAMLGEQHKLPVSTKPAEYLPELPDDVNDAMKVFVAEAKHRGDTLKGNAKFSADESEHIVSELTKIAKKLTLKRS